MAWKKEDAAPKANDGNTAVMDAPAPIAPPEKPKIARKVLFFSTYPQYWLGISSGNKVLKELTNGKSVYVDDNGHRHLQFHKHRLLVEPQLVSLIRDKPGYGMDFVEAIAQNDGDPRATSLEEMLESPQGKGFCKMLEAKQVETGDNKLAPLDSYALAAEIKVLRHTADYYEIKDEQGPEKAKAFWLKRSKLPEPK